MGIFTRNLMGIATHAELPDRRAETRVTVFVRDEYLVAALQRVEREVDVVNSEVSQLAGANYDYVVGTRDQGHIVGVRQHHKLERPADGVPNLLRPFIDRGTSVGVSPTQRQYSPGHT
ncbi:hypothetical protein [Microbacterium radiodurans]|uniref:hypothetical protein n=1 Tax=Microbacterium radiodurans TaxID=661398 RepID=UPI00168A597B|nr:hypothetical protein [Microbacterium radiodurans]